MKYGLCNYKWCGNIYLSTIALILYVDYITAIRYEPESEVPSLFTLVNCDLEIKQQIERKEKLLHARFIETYC